LKHWKKTAKYRQNEICKINDKNVNAIIETWPILRNPNGYVLIDEDFAFLNLTQKSVGLDEWKHFFDKLQICCPLSKNCTSTTTNELINILEQNDLSDGM